VGGYEELKFAILRQAVRDYQTALKYGYTAKQKRLEKWFLSDWAQYLSGDMGEVIIRKCKEGVVIDG
jgi:hypothetical protein